MFDPSVPSFLLEMQQWFGGIVRLPLENDGLLVQTHAKRDLVIEAAERIRPSKSLRPFRRMELYHQQYWWRLLKALQTNFPTVTRLFGYTDFNALIGVPYLTARPAHHWALCRLGDTLPDWLKTSYQENDRDLVLQAAEIDWATEEAFWIPEISREPLIGLSPTDILEAPLRLQPHVHLFALNRDFFSFREQFLKEDVNHWNTHPFPKLSERPCYFAIYRSPENQVSWKELSRLKYELLSSLNSGLTINAACEKIEKLGGEMFEEAVANLPFWFREWMSLGWLVMRETA